VVPGEGPTNARLIIIGEGPGYYEDSRGKPFVGRSGDYLNASLRRIGLDRADVYVTNMVKCRPPENRTPKPLELIACRSWLNGELNKETLPNARVLVLLGKTAQTLAFPDENTKLLRGVSRAMWLNDRPEPIIALATYHPAFILRNRTAEGLFLSDLLQAAKLMESTII